VRKGLISDDEELKKIVLETVRQREAQRKKAGEKAVPEAKPGK
jgi:hypothetical protein